MSVPETVDRALLTAAVVVIVIAGAALLERIRRGPSMLDRAISLDVCAALIIAGLGAKSAFARDSFYFPIMLVLAFLGFTGSVGIARFIAVRDRPPRHGRDRAGNGTEGPEGESR
ncbi:monovalent cation/H+ antiporter complex subunit F [Streptomyces sp. NBC_00257]|uniref:monovalent cation/H+ antiporter complex subunit F n=1 Tax=Streptomyces TaxID=1883 RepID=UPI00225B6E12|nr:MULTISPECIES: monovalent cation/H+ antiporter complex subunit F [unclassified Streptomyces]WSW04703.1 monovalent cation/H+ antiporter complex subunit F [Streptomyces sp. NBC_01005]WTB57430.1 monovalent cation/H+ antiporter complex subunit F [Streptomyces sp. NBC_00826]WTC94208.1 monovalent cation/H+ antiporter complex subunit F [Streptomyces sp. NBC_01650]WTH89688.1 monovalent cation/H+ antiporter complex subunit F [Streptomyces sp. NBC_00825]WTH98415.1 monovalent cation/H+ antiporter compl